MKTFTAILIAISCLHNQWVLGLTGGEPAIEGEFPFVVSVKDRFNCHCMAGTILGSIFVLTSGYKELWGGAISYGSNVLASNETSLQCAPYDDSTQIKIENFHFNEDAWAANPFTHDLLIIILEKPIIFGKNAQPIRLPETYEPWPFYETGTMVGWGYEGGEYPVIQTNLQKAQVSTYNDDFCSNSSLWDGYDLFAPTVMKCGGEINKTFFCIYDYGGPFIINGTQYGIISYAYPGLGEQCGGYFGIFAPTLTYREWIREITGI